MQKIFCLLLALALSSCAGTSGSSPYDPQRCDRNGDESQRRACWWGQGVQLRLFAAAVRALGALL